MPGRVATRPARFLRAISLLAILHASTNGAAAANEQAIQRLSCRGQSETAAPSPSSTASISFAVAIDEDENELLGLVDEESGKVLRLVYDAEVSRGAIQFDGEPERPAIWTRGKRNGGDYVGEAIGSDGEIITIRIDARAAAAVGGDFVLFDTARATLFKGTCR